MKTPFKKRNCSPRSSARRSPRSPRTSWRTGRNPAWADRPCGRTGASLPPKCRGLRCPARRQTSTTTTTTTRKTRKTTRTTTARIWYHQQERTKTATAVTAAATSVFLTRNRVIRRNAWSIWIICCCCVFYWKKNQSRSHLSKWGQIEVGDGHGVIRQIGR